MVNFNRDGIYLKDYIFTFYQKNNTFCPGRRISWHHRCIALLYQIPMGNFNYVMHRKANTHAYASFQRLIAIVLCLEEAGIWWQMYNLYKIIKFKAVVTKKTQDGVLRLMGFHGGFNCVCTLKRVHPKLSVHS